MALDEPNNEDSVFEEGGFTFCINKELLKTVEGVKLDLNYMGFSVEPNKPLASSGSSCGGCSSSGSCGSA